MGRDGAPRAARRVLRRARTDEGRGQGCAIDDVLQAALTEPEFVESLETPGAARDTVIAFLFYAFVATAHTERASHVLAGLTFGRGFAARRVIVAEWDRGVRYRVRRARRVEIGERGRGRRVVRTSVFEGDELSEIDAIYRVAGVFSERFRDERNAWFDRLFASLNHYATCFTSCVKEVHATAFVHESKCAMWETFGRLYTHARLLETSVASVPKRFWIGKTVPRFWDGWSRRSISSCARASTWRSGNR